MTNLRQINGSATGESQTTGATPTTAEPKVAKKFDDFGFDLYLTTHHNNVKSNDFTLLYFAIDSAEVNLIEIIKRRINEACPLDEIIEFRDLTQLSELKANLVMSFEAELQRKIAGE